MIRKRRLCKQQATESLIENKSEKENNDTAKRKCADLTLKTVLLESELESSSTTNGKTKICERSVKPLQCGECTIDPDEDDHFEAVDVETKADFDEPDCVSPESPWYQKSGVSDLNDLKKEKSGNPFFMLFNDKKSTESVVYIQHGRATDSVDGDIFGADIYTDESDKKKEYFRHFFCKLDRDSPADKMKVQKGDELVMVNDTFAPGLNHKQIMELFSRIPVDGFTRFTMILRRKAHHSRTFTSKQWEWFETSAIFVPEFDKEPETKDLHYNPISNNMWDKTTPHRYKVIGQQDFLTLSKDGVGVDILHGNKVKDEYKSIWKHAIVRENASDATKLVFEASLSCADRKYFATIHCNNVTVVEKEVFFQYRTVGSQIYFKQGNSYLNCRNRTVGASTDEQFFEEFGSPGHRDVVDGCCTSACYTTGSTLESRRITRSMSRQPSYTTQFSHMSV